MTQSPMALELLLYTPQILLIPILIHAKHTDMRTQTHYQTEINLCRALRRMDGGSFGMLMSSVVRQPSSRTERRPPWDKVLVKASKKKMSVKARPVSVTVAGGGLCDVSWPR